MIVLEQFKSGRQTHIDELPRANPYKIPISYFEENIEPFCKI